MRKKISLNTSLLDFSPFPTASPEKIFYYDAESMSSKASISMGNPVSCHDNRYPNAFQKLLLSDW